MINKKQRFICIIATVIFIASCWFITPCKIAYAATSGDIEYTVSGGQTTIMQDGFVFDTTTGTITDYTGDASILNIPSTINDVSVIAIGRSAFTDCANLTYVSIPSSVKSIGVQAFFALKSLTSVSISSGVSSIRQNAFSACDALMEINVSQANAAYKSFNGVLFTKDGETLIHFPGGITGAYTIPSTVIRINWEAFARCKITSINIPSSVREIDVQAFLECKNLSSVSISSGVTDIKYNAFAMCDKLTSVDIPSSVTFIDDNAFGYCQTLTTINVSTSNTHYKSVNGVLFTKDGKTLEEYPCGLTGGYTIPSGTERIGGAAFGGCKNLKDISMPSSLKYIEHDAFSSCSSLTSVSIPYGVTCIGAYAFSCCTGLESITIPSSVEAILVAAFDMCTSLKSTTIPTSVTFIGEQAFQYCDLLTIYGFAGSYAQTYAEAHSISFKAIGQAVSEVRLDKSEIRLNIGETVTLTALVSPSNATIKNVTWASSNTSIATVSKGTVSAIGAGMVAITVVTEDGNYNDTCIVTVSIPKVSYQTHVQNVGWQGWKSNGEVAGTSGQSLRLEGMNIEIDGMPDAIEYRTHVQDIGWQGWVRDGEMSGTSGRALRLEAIEIRLTGYMAANYDIYYRVHAQNIGWMDWAKNGQSSGTAGLSYRLEAIQIQLVPKGGAAPGSTAVPFKNANGPVPTNPDPNGPVPTNPSSDVPVRYQTHVQNIGWQGWKSSGEVAGTSGQSLRLEGMCIDVDGVDNAIEYRTHVQNIGWQDWVNEGEMTGTSGRSLRLEAIEIRLKGDMAANYDIYYRVHAQNIGWMDWAKNGQSAGTAGLSYRLEAIQIVIVQKGGTAPGSTARPYVSA